MSALLRNSRVRYAVELWWLPVLGVALVALGAGGRFGFTLASSGLAVIAGLAAGVVGSVVLRDRRASRREVERLRAEGLRSLCPNCLRFEAPAFACPHCAKQVEGLVVRSRGAYVDTCGSCGNRLSLAPDAEPLPAYCPGCASCGPASERHNRAVRVLGVLCDEDLEEIGRTLGVTPTTQAGLRTVHRDQGTATLYVLNLGGLTRSREPLPIGHAARATEALWVRQADPLIQAEVVDRFALRAGLSDPELKRIRLAAAGPFEPVAERTLGARLGSLHSGVPADAFLNSPSGVGG